jgi:hypothetical protein
MLNIFVWIQISSRPRWIIIFPLKAKFFSSLVSYIFCPKAHRGNHLSHVTLVGNYNKVRRGLNKIKNMVLT